MADRFGVPYADFQKRETDHLFGVDPAPHMAHEGWFYVDQVLDDFFHGNLEQFLGQRMLPDSILSGDSNRSGTPLG